MNDFLKGKLEVGDKVGVAHSVAPEVPTPQRLRELLSDLDDSTVVFIDGNLLTLSSKDGLEIEIHRKYFCRLPLIGHAENPCIFCGYREYDKTVT